MKEALNFDVGELICGQVVYNPATADEQLPGIIIEGKRYGWEELGKALMTYEGYYFQMIMVDPAEEI